MSLNPRLTQGVSSIPLDPPPFILERHVSLPVTRSAMWAVVLSSLLLVGFRVLFAHTGRSIPPLLWLMAASITAAGLYLGVRFITYWAVWSRVVRTYPLVGRTHPAARGELPKRSFVFVLVIPIATCIALGVVLIYLGSGFSPELVLAMAVVAGVALRDVRALGHVLFLECSYWIRDTPAGLEVLKPAP